MSGMMGETMEGDWEVAGGSRYTCPLVRARSQVPQKRRSDSVRITFSEGDEALEAHVTA